jgi:hypothetical protein
VPIRTDWSGLKNAELTPEGMMRTASKILDEGTPQSNSSKVEKGPVRCFRADIGFSIDEISLGTFDVRL